MQWGLDPSSVRGSSSEDGLFSADIKDKLEFSGCSGEQRESLPGRGNSLCKGSEAGREREAQDGPGPTCRGEGFACPTVRTTASSPEALSELSELILGAQRGSQGAGRGWLQLSR